MASPTSLLFLSIALVGAHADYAVLHVHAHTGEDQDFCVNFNPRFRSLPALYDAKAPHGLVDLTETQSCQDVALLPFQFRDSVVAMAADACLYSEASLEALQRRESYALLVVNLANSSSLVMPSLQDPDLYKNMQLKVASISHEDFLSVKEVGANASLWLYQPAVPRFDPSMVLIILLALVCVVAGALWAEKIPAEEDKTTQTLWNTCCAGYFYLLSCGKRCETLGGFLILLTYLGFLSSLLVLLYFFYSFMVYIFIALFCVYGSLALCACLLPVWRKLLPWDCRLPLVKWEPEVRAVILFLICAALAVFWAVMRHASYAWTLQDLLGLAICVYCIRDFRVPNFKICCIILAIVFVYDVFFVFITPFFTKDGRSVMESVALGGQETDSAPAQTSPREQIPILFRLPALMTSPLRKCLQASMLALGFGDVVFPGILIVHNIRFDLKVQSPCRLYFVTTCVAYVISLVLAYVGVVLMERGQPALLYIVPLTLAVSVGVALARKELRFLYTGHAPFGLLEHEEREMEALPSQECLEKEGEGDGRGSRR